MIGDQLQDEEFQWCETCRGHIDGTCDVCRRRFESGEASYRSQSFHVHPAMVGGVSGTRAIHKRLCVDCYRVDHAKTYPNQKVPDLPDFFPAVETPLQKLYREAVKLCHPDLAVGDADRARRHRWMIKANQANQQRDADTLQFIIEEFGGAAPAPASPISIDDFFREARG